MLHENRPVFTGMAGHTACLLTWHIAGLITAGRRECWGSQTGGQRGITFRGAPFVLLCGGRYPGSRCGLI